jgi:hypothetical protein
MPASMPQRIRQCLLSLWNRLAIIAKPFYQQPVDIVIHKRLGGINFAQ